MLVPEFAEVVLNHTDPDGLFSSAVFQVGLDVCDACKNLLVLKVPAVRPRSDNNVPLPSSSLIVLKPAVLSPNARPLWNISKLPVVLFTDALTPGTFALENAVATSDKAVPAACTCTPLT